MKYLKKFNESLMVDSLTEFCEENLVGLTDNGFSINVYSDSIAYCVEIGKDFIKNNGDVNFKWSYIKDDIIVFMELLNTKYEIIKHIELRGDIKYNYSVRFTLEDILNDNVPENLVFDLITFYLKIEK